MKMIYVATMATKPDRDSQWVMAFKECGIEVITFATQDEKNYSRKTIIEKIQHRFQVGNHYKALHKNLIELVKKEKPDWVHFRLPIEFRKSTIKTINQLDIKVTQYFNDDPFSKEAVLGLNNTFKKALKLYDANFVYRQRNIKDFESAGAKKCISLSTSICAIKA